MSAAVHSAAFAGGRARRIRCSESIPQVASAEEYELWLISVEKHVAADGVRRMRKINGATLRRAIILLRSGYDTTNAARAVGFSNAGGLKRWLAKLPPELAA
jgi:hypothetical protein